MYGFPVLPPNLLVLFARHDRPVAEFDRATSQVFDVELRIFQETPANRYEVVGLLLASLALLSTSFGDADLLKPLHSGSLRP